MRIKFIDPKSDFKISEITRGEEFTLPLENHHYRLNKSLIPLIRLRKKVVFFSFQLAKIFELSAEDYNDYIENFSDRKNIPRILIDLGIVVNENSPDELKIIQPSFYFRNLQLNLAPICNLRCKYCYALSNRRPEKKVMSFALAKKAVDYVSRFCGKELNLQFVGAGEPTLNMQLIKKLFAYAKTKVSKVKINPISTNGAISLSTAKWLAENAYSVQISCDGPPFIQDKYRPLVGGRKSSSLVERTIRYFVKKNKVFYVRATLVEDIFGNEKKVMNYFFNLGVKYLNFARLENVGLARKMHSLKGFRQNKALNQSLAFVEIQKLMELQDELGMKNYTTSLRQIGYQVTCPIYTKNKFVLDYYGNVSACEDYNGPFDFQEFPFFKDFIIGHYNFKKGEFEINFKKLDTLIKTIDKEMRVNHCFNCSLFSACTKICLYQIGVDTGSISSNHLTCDKIGKTWPIITFHYLADKYLVKKRPCLEIKEGKLFYSLFFYRFKLYLQKAGEKMKDNPYIYIPNLNNLDLLFQDIIKHKNSREELTLFLLKFRFSNNELNLNSGRNILRFLKKLRENHVYFRISRPLPEALFGYRYKEVCKELNLPRDFKNCLELYIVKNNCILFPNGRKGSKKFDEYDDREEIYKDFLSL